jgi:hypothetical protein
MPATPYSQSPLVKKLAIKPRTRITALNAINGFIDMLGELPPQTSYEGNLEGDFDWITAFVKTESELDGLIESIKKHLKPTGTLWVAIPRAKNSPLNRNTLTASQARYGLDITSNAVINDDWTAYRYKKV